MTSADEKEIRADERRRLAALLRGNVKAISSVAADEEAAVLLVALLLELGEVGHDQS